MDNQSVGIVETKIITLFEPPNELLLDSGRKLGPIQVAYETYGELSRQADNAVLICHALSGDAHVAGYHSADDKKPGWWDNMVGPGKWIDTNKYFVICTNVLGGCKGTTGPGSINPETGKPWGLDFPVITIGDMVRVQKGLIDALGIKRILAVVGGSMGGMQVLDWAIRYPDVVVSAVPIATTARLTAQGIAFNAVGRNAIIGDPNFQNGQYYGGKQPARGLSIARMIGHITYLSEQSMHEKFGRTLRNAENYSYDFDSEFAVETYLDYQGQRFVERFDANSYLYITKAIDYFDLAANYGDGSLEQAFAGTKSRFMVASFSSDWLFPPSQSRQIVHALLAQDKDVTYGNIESPYGHDAFLLEVDSLGAMIGGFLDGTYRYIQRGLPIMASCELPVKKHEPEYTVISEKIDINSRVLDLGCGTGDLLQLLSEERGTNGCGIELQEKRIIECVKRGVTVIQHDLDIGLPTFPDNSFDYVILSHTLPEVHQPELVLREMLRIGRLGIVSFPNFASWQARIQFAFYGKAPVTPGMPNAWHQTERIRFMSLKDFEAFCKVIGAKIIDKIALNKKGRRIPFLDNILADQAIYILSQDAPSPVD